jgi:pyruvate,water dikinase
MREDTRSEYVRDRWLVRSFAVRVGELAGIGDAVFFLTVEEMLDVLAGKEIAAAKISARRGMYGRLTALPSYPVVIRGHFDPFRWVKDPNRRTDFFGSAVAVASQEGIDTIAGSAASAGWVEGVVRRLDSPADGPLLQQGEVLVIAQADIAWTLLFPRAAAIVTDVGAPLSHAAIVARELGIPAVMGCTNATARLRTGDRVRVDGARGTVEQLVS